MCNLEERKQVELDKIINIYLGNIKNFTKQGNILFFNKTDYTYSQLKGILKSSTKRVNDYIKNTYGEKFTKGWLELKNFNNFYEVHFKFPKLLSDAYEVKEGISSYKEKFNEIPSISLEDDDNLSYFDEVGDYKVRYSSTQYQKLTEEEKAKTIEQVTKEHRSITALKDLAIEEKIAELAENTKDEKIANTPLEKFIQWLKNLFRNIYKERYNYERLIRDINQGKFAKQIEDLYLKALEISEEEIEERIKKCK